jgi:hypothetical protein
MAENMKFESRVGILSCSPEIFFNFATDIRNLEQFIPEGSVTNWKASSDECSFTVPPLGSASARISSKHANSKIEYSGEALQKNNFNLVLNIFENEDNLAEVRVLFSSDLNPVLRMMVAGPIEKFLEILIKEMEKFDKWNVVVSGK